ncbi:MarR family transcriptional regulator [Flavobacteriaceae bacterium Ap0902]|nr:MarR family transcriptional regulator [Flavobacteriaceae bacterium Ap0902]
MKKCINNYASIIIFIIFTIVKELKKNIQPTIDYMLRTTWNAVVKSYNTEAIKYDFTMPMGFSLISIDPKTGTPSTALGPRMGMEPTSLSRTLKNLEGRGLIERHPNPEDGRGVIIKLTPDGLEHRNIAKRVVTKFNDTVRGEFGDEKIAIFYEVCSGIQNLIEEKKIF